MYQKFDTDKVVTLWQASINMLAGGVSVPVKRARLLTGLPRRSTARV